MQFSLPHLFAAWEQVRTRTPAAGIDGITTELFAGVVRPELRMLQRQLQREKYAALPAKGFYLKKKSGGRRLIGIPTVRDRVVQRFLLQGIYPALEEVFSDCSYAYRPGLGVATAIEHFSELYLPHPVWTIKADITQFFDRLCWALLLTHLERLPIDFQMVQLIEQQLEAGIVADGRPLRKTQGVVQGSILSGALANLYLSEFDRQCLCEGIHLVRYGDDFVAVTPGLLEATRVLARLQNGLEEIHLSLNVQKTRIIAPHESFTFLGYQFQAGEIVAPERKCPKPRSPTTRRRPNEPSRPPRACSIVKSSERKKKNAARISSHSHSDNFWSESMTTLYITEQGAYVKVKNQQFQVYHNSELLISVPVNRVSHMVLFGCCNLSHGAVSLALRRRIPVMFLSHQGRYFGRLQAEGMAEVEYLAMQVQRSLDAEFVLRQAKAIVEGKLHNARILLRRLNRRPSHRTAKATEAIERLLGWSEKMSDAESIETLLGYEGQGTHLYYRAFGTLLSEPFEFNRRTRRPPTDPINSMLSLGYTLVHQNIYSLVQAIGLHPHFGNLHVPRKNHPALVSDLVEEFRAPIVDSLVAYLVNSKILAPEDFTPPDARGGVYLYPDALKKFLKHWQEKLQKEVTHPHTGYKVSYHRCLELQIWEYIACLMGEQPVYRPMKIVK